MWHAIHLNLIFLLHFFWRTTKILRTTDCVSTAVGLVVACAPVTQPAQVQSLIGTSSPEWGFFGVFPHLWGKCQEALGPQGPRISFGCHYHHQSLIRAPMTWDVYAPYKTSNTQILQVVRGPLFEKRFPKEMKRDLQFVIKSTPRINWVGIFWSLKTFLIALHLSIEFFTFIK